jgi:hypothetical protein
VVNPGAVDTGKHSRAWRLSLCASLLIHLAAATALAVWSVARSIRLTFRRTILSNALEVTYTKIRGRGPGEGAPDIVDNLLASIPERLESVKKMKPEERAKKMRKGIKDMSKVRESSLNEMADLFAAEDRAYEPVVPPPAGPFDFDSQIPYSMKKTDDGGFSVVLLDKDGRTLAVTHPKEEVTEDLKTAYEVFQMMEQMPAFKKLYMRFAAQYLPQMKGEEDE